MWSRDVSEMSERVRALLTTDIYVNESFRRISLFGTGFLFTKGHRGRVDPVSG